MSQSLQFKCVLPTGFVMGGLLAIYWGCNLYLSVYGSQILARIDNYFGHFLPRTNFHAAITKNLLMAVMFDY